MSGDDGVEILDSAVSTTSSAVTHEIDKKHHRLDDTGGNTTAPEEVAAGDTAAAASTGEEESKLAKMSESNVRNTGVGESPQVVAAVGMDFKTEASASGSTKAKEHEVPAPSDPFDEEHSAPTGLPIVQIEPDDVSSLHHTEAEDLNKAGGGSGSRYGAGSGAPQSYMHEQSKEPTIEEGETYYEEEDAEQVKALQRRNMLIIFMLVVFLGLVVAIGVGVGLAVKNNDTQPADNQVIEPPPPAPATNDTDDDGGLDQDDIYPTDTPSSAPSSSGPCIDIEIGIIFDEYTDETSWQLVRGNYYPENPEQNDVVWKSKYYNPTEYSKRADTLTKCFPAGYYTFVFMDEEGDGICCYHGDGSYILTTEGKVVKIGGPMNSDYETVTFELPYEEPEPLDVNGDGLDDRLGHVMPYDSSNFTEGVDCENFRLVILTDEYGIETTWELYEGKDKSGKLIANGGPYGSEFTYVIDECLKSPQEYALYMYDWDRRGLCCESGEGWYKVTSGDIVIVDTNSQFGEVNITRFVLPADGSVVFSEPTQSPTFTVPAGEKTLYPTGSPVTPAPTKVATASPTVPTLTVLADGKVITDFPTVAADGPVRRKVRAVKDKKGRD